MTKTPTAPAVLCSNCQTSKPKLPLSAYFFFAKVMGVKLRNEAAETENPLSITEAAKRCGTMWASLAAEEKEPYN